MADYRIGLLPTPLAITHAFRRGLRPTNSSRLLHGDIAVIVPSPQVEHLPETLLQPAAQMVLAHKLREDPPSQIIVDLAEVSYFGSAFITFLLRCHNLLHERGSDSGSGRGESGMILELLRITNLDNHWAKALRHGPGSDSNARRRELTSNRRSAVYFRSRCFERIRVLEFRVGSISSSVTIFDPPFSPRITFNPFAFNNPRVNLPQEANRSCGMGASALVMMVCSAGRRSAISAAGR